MSRLPGQQPKNDSDERLQHRFRTLIPEHKVHPDILHSLLNKNQVVDHISAISHETSITEAISLAYENNDIAKLIILSLQDTSKPWWPGPLRLLLRKDKVEFKINAGFVYFRKRLFVPDYENLRLEIVHRSHSSGPAGHPGRVKTLDLLQRTYWWPQMTQFVADFVKGCALCFRTKTPRSLPPGFLKPLEIPVRAWSDISIDHVVDLPPCKRDGKIFQNILVVVDRLTKMRHFIPTTSLDTSELVDCFIKNIYRLHGAPDSIISDRSSAFVAEFWHRINTCLSITLKPSSTFHPQTDSQTDMVNASLNQYLRAHVSFT